MKNVARTLRWSNRLRMRIVLLRTRRSHWSHSSRLIACARLCTQNQSSRSIESAFFIDLPTRYRVVVLTSSDRTVPISRNRVVVLTSSNRTVPISRNRVVVMTSSNRTVPLSRNRVVVLTSSNRTVPISRNRLVVLTSSNRTVPISRNRVVV